MTLELNKAMSTKRFFALCKHAPSPRMHNLFSSPLEDFKTSFQWKMEAKMFCGQRKLIIILW